MKFRTPAQNTRTYTIVPAKYVERAGRREMTTDFLRVKFEGGQLDTIMAQKIGRWTDEQRQQVEAYLLNHTDFGLPQGIHLETDQQLPDYITSQFPEIELQGSQDGATPCVFAVRFGDSSEVCGRLATQGPYCDAHAQLATAVPAPMRRGVRSPKVAAEA